MSSKRSAPSRPRLVSGRVLPDLRMVPTAAAILHEQCDAGRVERITTRLRQDGVLRNPPIVADLDDERYVVLDGANRTSALHALGVSAIPVQVVDYADPIVRLEVWYHLLTDPSDLPDRLRAQRLPLRAATAAEAARWLADRSVACYLITPSGVSAIPTAPSMQTLSTVLAQVVGAYSSATRIHRVMTTNLEELTAQYGAVGVVVVFPTFSKDEILEVADTTAKLPAGITRHVIAGRALRVNVPLEVLSAATSVGEKDRWLRARIHELLLDDRIRYYPEASFLFDE